MDEYTIQDVLADGRRHSPRWASWPITIGALLWAISVFVMLERPGLSDAARTFWEIAPWPFLATGLMSWILLERRLGKVEQAGVERALDHKAAYTAWNFSTFWYMGAILLEASGVAIELREVIIGPILVFFFTHARLWKRTVGIKVSSRPHND